MKKLLKWIAGAVAFFVSGILATLIVASKKNRNVEIESEEAIERGKNEIEKADAVALVNGSSDMERHSAKIRDIEHDNAERIRDRIRSELQRGDCGGDIADCD